MSKIPEYYTLGNTENLSTEELSRVLLDIYKDLAQAINSKPDIFIRSTDGLATDVDLADGSININDSTYKVEALSKTCNFK